MRDPGDVHAHVPSAAHSLAKTLSWRAFATLDTFLISFLVTGSVGFAGSIASFEVLTKMLFYYVHERLWARIPWGRQAWSLALRRRR